MKRLFTLLCYSFCSLPLIGQSVTISPTSTSAIIQSSSTTNGFLPPRMSKSQREAIVNPVNGLLVFQNTSNVDSPPGYYWYNGAYWRRLVEANELSWNVNNNNQSSAVSGNVGIGTIAPENKLHVRSSNSSVGITLDGINPIFQLRQSNFPTAGYMETGFLQLSGNDIRIGVNSSNTTGRFIIRTQGADQIEVLENLGGAKMYFNAGGANIGLISASTGGDLHLSSLGNSTYVALNTELYVTEGQRVGIGTGSPEEKLDVRGNVQILGSIAMAGEITKTNVAEGSFLPLCYGKVGFSGDRVSGSSNFTSDNPSTGRYNIFNPSILPGSTIIVTLNSSNAQIVASAGCNTGECHVYLKDGFSNNNSFAPINQAFYFVIYR